MGTRGHSGSERDRKDELSLAFFGALAERLRSAILVKSAVADVGPWEEILPVSQLKTHRFRARSVLVKRVV